jgi:hypothetical protein
MNIKLGISGYYKFEAVSIDADGTEHRRLLRDWQKNRITNAGLDFVGSSTTALNFCQVGTGSTPVDDGDTALDAYLVGTSTILSDTYGIDSGGARYGWRRKVYRFAQGAAAGNIAEVGIGTASSGGTLFSRSLIVDEAGDPTSITILPTEFLDVTYEIRLYVPTGDISAVVTISSVDYDLVIRPAVNTSQSYWAISIPLAINVPNDGYRAIIPCSGDLARENSEPSGSLVGSSVGATYDTYVPGSYRLRLYYTGRSALPRGMGVYDRSFCIL